MQSLCHDLKVEVFKYTTSPISLVATNRDWRAISQDPYTRADWLIYKYGISHALFHAVRLGRSFLTVEVVQALLSKKAVFSRYFIQRLFKNFGTHDEKLMKFKEQRDLNQINRIIRKETWGSSLHMEVFKILLIKGFSIFHNCEIKGNDMELFHLLSAGPLDVNYAPQILRQNIDSIEDLILKYKFIPFPKRPKAVYEDTVEYAELMQARANEEHSLRYGYESNFQLDVVAGAILIHPDLISLWNKIGYYEICNDVNEIVMRGALLILFPLNPPNNWERPDVNTIVTRLKQLIKLGFHLTYNVLEEIFHLFEHRLNEIGDLLMNSIKEIFDESKSVIAESCLIWAIKPERNHEKTDLLKFLIDRIDQPEKALKNALDHYKVGFRFDFKSIKTTNEIRSLTVNSNLYYWILKSYGPSSEITQQCFDDIVESRTWIDLKLQGTSGSDGPIRLTTCAFNSICSIYLEFCNDKVPFKPCYLQYLQLVNNNEIIEPFFEMSLPITFGLQLKGTFPFDITYDYKRPKVDVQNHKRQFNVMNDNQQTTKERKNWYDLLKKYEEQILGNNFELTERFKNNFEKFWPLFIDYDQMNDGDDFVVEGTSSKRLKQ